MRLPRLFSLENLPPGKKRKKDEHEFVLALGIGADKLKGEAREFPVVACKAGHLAHGSHHEHDTGQPAGAIAALG
jgi:hypothetical protein